LVAVLKVNKKSNELELSKGIKIPGELRDLIVKKGRTVFERKKFTRVVDQNFQQELTLESIFPIDEIIKAMNFLSEEEDILKNKVMVFGETLGSPVICIGLGEKNNDFVFVFDWDFGLTKVSGSFVEFINSLQ